MRPRIRTVKPEMRQDERYARMSYPARELFNGLITMADDEGRFRAPTSAILGHVFPYDENAPRKLREWVAEVKASRMVLFYVHEGTPYGAFRHWARHQKINRPSPSVLPEPPDPQVVRENSLIKTDKGWKQALALSEYSVSNHDAFSERSMIVHGSFTDRSRSPARDARSGPVVSSEETTQGRQTGDARAEYLRLSVLLAEQVTQRDENAKVAPQSGRWLDAIRLLHERDGRPLEQIEAVIRWLPSDFWGTVVLSTPKLREKFTQLVAKMGGVPGAAPDGHDAVRRRRAAALQAELEKGREAAA